MPSSMQASALAVISACLAFLSTVEANSLQTNPYNNTQINITNWGTRFLWAWFAIMALSAVAIGLWTLKLPVQHRAFHWIALAILTTASIAYFSMASNLGYSGVNAEFSHRGTGNRQIWWVRYIDWFITTPLLLLELLLTTGLPLSAVFITIFMDIVMIVTGLAGSQVASSYKWGYFAFGCVAMFYILYTLIGPARKSTRFFGAAHTKAFTSSAAILLFLWCIYPICWGLSEGGNVISPNAEMVFYGVLDFLAKPMFCFYHLYSIRNLDYESLRLRSGKASAYATTKYGNVAPGETTGSAVGGSTVQPAMMSTHNPDNVVPNVTQLNDRMGQPINPTGEVLPKDEPNVGPHHNRMQHSEVVV